MRIRATASAAALAHINLIISDVLQNSSRPGSGINSLERHKPNEKRGDKERALLLRNGHKGKVGVLSSSAKLAKSRPITLWPNGLYSKCARARSSPGLRLFRRFVSVIARQRGRTMRTFARFVAPSLSVNS